MLLINKEQAQTKFLVTLTEVAPASPVYKLFIHSRFNNKTLEFEVGANQSAHKSRFDEFVFDTTVFNALQPGKYFYWFQELTSQKTIEQGVLMVIDKARTESQKVDDQFTFITPAASEDDFVVFD